jgi:hypothetical protein
VFFDQESEQGFGDSFNRYGWSIRGVVAFLELAQQRLGGCGGVRRRVRP